MAYIEDVYLDMMVRSLPLWRELQAFAGIELMAQTGGLQFAPIGTGRLSAQAATYERRGLPYERLSAAAVNERFPQFRLRDGEDEALFSPDIGVHFASKCVAAAWDYAASLGVVTVMPFRAASLKQDGSAGSSRILVEA